MTAKILIVDDIPANLKLLDVKLTAEYFEVLEASCGADALEIAKEERPDIILLDVMMPGMDGFEVCRRLRASEETRHIPVVMVTALDRQSDRVRGLEAGADDFLTKPLNDTALFARVRSLVRLKQLMDELRMREETGRRIGVMPDPGEQDTGPPRKGRALLIDDSALSSRQIAGILQETVAVESIAAMDCVTDTVVKGCFDAVIISLSLKDVDGLRICSQLRSAEATRNIPLVVLAEEGETDRLLRAMEIGVNDYIIRPVDSSELQARCRTQLRQKRYQDQLRRNIESGLEAAITDPLTGLYNRRYIEQHLDTLQAEYIETRRSITLLVLDIDFFKSVNDTYGHPVGDEVLKEFARRLKQGLREYDMQCRVGGEEFIVVMPDTDITRGYTVAERLRLHVTGTPFSVASDIQLDITVSIGIAAMQGADDTTEKLLERADSALYRAKQEGRNRVVTAAA